MGIQATQERVGYIPAGSRGWGRGASSCYTFCESEHMEGKGKQSRPTHPLQPVNTPLLSPLFSRCRATHHDPLSYLPDKINIRPLHQKSLFFSAAPFLLPLPRWGGETSMSPFEKKQTALSLHARNMGGSAVGGHASAKRDHHYKTLSPSVAIWSYRVNQAEI